MGKYMRKAKVTGEVAVMEFPHQSTLGVRTRARTLALQRLQKPDPSAYLELRSRRLQKPFFAAAAARHKESPRPNPPPKPAPRAATGPGGGSGVANSGPVGSNGEEEEAAVASVATPEIDAGVEVSLGENVLELEAGGRYSRETTPCSLIRDPETIGTPGSTNRHSKSTTTNQRTRSSTRRDIPSAHEMEEFFAGPEKLQQKIFEEKYNFDPVNDKPLPGRYEWVKLDS